MGKNNSVKKIDEEQILKRFEYTVQEYIRFYDFYKNQEVSEENTEAFYVMLQTKLMILRKYDYNREEETSASVIFMGDPTDEKHDIKNSPYWKGPHWGLTPMWSNQKTFRKIA